MSDYVKSICDSFESLKDGLIQCQDCCNGDYKSYHCILCPIDKFKPTRLRKVENHLQVHWKTRVQGSNGLFSVACHLTHGSEDSCRHYHCPVCLKVFKSRKDNLIRHVAKCNGRSSENVSEPHPVDSSSCRQNTASHHTQNGNLSALSDHLYSTPLSKDKTIHTEATVRCTVCNKLFSRGWIRSHMKIHENKEGEISKTKHHYTVVIDEQKGLYTSAVTMKGLRQPIHVQKVTHGSNESYCENIACHFLKDTAVRGSNMAYECPHLRSVQYAKHADVAVMQTSSLDSLLEDGIITMEKHLEILNMYQKSVENKSPLIVRIPNDFSTSKRYIFFSVYSEDIRYWSRLGRTVTTYDTVGNKITCKCSTGRRYCNHKLLVKWYLFQEIPEMYNSQVEIEEDLDHDDQEPWQISQPTGITTDDVMVQYLKTNKKIPQNIHQPAEFRFNESVNSPFTLKELVPTENSCIQCDVQLRRQELRSIQIVFMNRIDTETRLYEKNCPQCNRSYHYREWSDGVHNFNNKLVLGLDVCRFIRSGLENHIAIGRSIGTLENILGTTLHKQEMEAAYLNFEALCDHEYEFNCILCGYYPKVVIWDTFRKASFRYAVSDLKIPTEDICEVVDARAFWNDIENKIVAEGQSKANRLVDISPAFDNWAPWIGEKSRRGNLLYNTEFKKCSKTNDDEISEPMPEELLNHLMSDEKITNIRKICREIGISSNGSKMDMILRIRERSISRGAFDKAYEKVFGSTGGWAVGCCGHGVVYAIKCLLRSESPRDYVDLEQSLKHIPNITICDIAHLVAKHGNKRFKDMFTPNEGRLAPATEEIIALAESGRLRFATTFLENQPQDTDAQMDHEINPTTSSDVHFALFDWFHEGNCKKREEILRKSSLLKEVAGIIDTQAVEQLFNASKRDIYFLNNMSALRHLFLFRLIYHLRNNKLNKELRRKLDAEFHGNLIFNNLGQVRQTYLNSETGNKGIDMSADSHDATFLPPVINSRSSPIPKLYVAQKISPVSKPRTANTNTKSFLELQPRETYLQALMTMQDRIEIPQIKLIYDIASAIISSESAMSAEESVAFLYNLRYANSVLYRQANYQRQMEIKTHMSPFGLFQSQGTSNYCGLCAINNIMGPAENGSFPVSVHEMDNTADLMWINMIDNPALGILERAEPLRDREGFYSYEVISALLEARGISLARISADAIEDLPPTEVHLLLLHQAKAETCDLLVRLKSSAHWLAIRVMRDRIFIMDSRQIQPSPLSIEDAAHFIKGHSRHPGAVDIVVKSKTTVTDQDMSEVKCEDNKRIPACPRDDRSEEGERYYELRKKPTQKRRKSFWYELDQKKNGKGLQSCSMEDILRNTDKKDDLQSDKEGSMKDMSTSSELEHDAVSDMSTSSELEHDVVSDMSMSSELERCWSSDVEQLQKDSPDNQEIGGSEEEEEEEEDDIDDDFSLEFADFEKMGILTYIYEIMHCMDSTCDEADHERHHQFICNPETIYNKERKRVAFGFGVVSNKIISALLKYLTEELVYSHQVPFRFGGRRIRKLKNIELNNIFLKYKFFADNYVTFVLHKEAIIYFLQKTTMCPYEMGNEQCMEKEIDVNNEVQKKYRK